MERRRSSRGCGPDRVRDSELRRVDAVGVVESEGGQVARARGENIALGGAESFEGAAEVGVVAGGGGFDAGLVGEGASWSGSANV